MVNILDGPTILFFSLFIVMLICFPDWSYICNSVYLCSFCRRTRSDPLQVPLDISTEDDNDFHESSISSIVNNETFTDVGSV